VRWLNDYGIGYSLRNVLEILELKRVGLRECFVASRRKRSEIRVSEVGESSRLAFRCEVIRINEEVRRWS